MSLTHICFWPHNLSVSVLHSYNPSYSLLLSWHPKEKSFSLCFHSLKLPSSSTMSSEVPFFFLLLLSRTPETLSHRCSHFNAQGPQLLHLRVMDFQCFDNEICHMVVPSLLQYLSVSCLEMHEFSHSLKLPLHKVLSDQPPLTSLLCKVNLIKLLLPSSLNL